ncbi:DUF2603 domain-containing protein [Helicobacter equorum]|uniref:UPF0763 protein CQA54_00410 n=2 Tax=Helicobacteraceae TaxID=72293 RepID=A0A3D8ITQ4_9HELI|nr:DUF2603 domain-containing protein [Helicobacter equorum]
MATKAKCIMKFTKNELLLQEDVHQQFGVGYLSKIDDKSALLKLQEGNLNNTKDIWFLQDNENHEFVLMPQGMLNTLLKRIKTIQEEKLFMKLEREIVAQMPIDFDDAMSVAQMYVESHRQSDGSLPALNVTSVVRDIKKQHPNLFFNLDEYILKQKQGVSDD